MIKKIPLFIQLIVLGLGFAAPAQQEQQQKEYVQVVNVEMILRVLQDGVPVGGLKKEDFTLTEDGEPCEINGFFENHRRLAHADESKNELQQPRLYLLFFWVNNPGADVATVLDKFFSDIYRSGDRVILSTPARTFELPSANDIESISAAFQKQWQQEAKDKLLRKIQFHGELNRLLEDLIKKLADLTVKKTEQKPENFLIRFDTPVGKELKYFANQYERTVQEYRLREFSTDLNTFETMARSMADKKNDKFALVIFQHDTLPFFNVANVKGLCMTKRIPDEITAELTAAMLKTEEQTKNALNTRIFTEQIKSLFIQANIQFHLLYLTPFESDRHGNANAFFSLTQNKEIFSNWDYILQELSRISGGLKLDGDRTTDALDQVASFEDIYYHITYVPREQGTKKRKIDIRVKQPGMQVIFGRSLQMKELPLVKITELSVNDRLISLAVADFYTIDREGVPTGFVNIEVAGRQTDNEASRPLLSQASETYGQIELPFAFPQAGNWDIEVRVIDQITGHQDVRKAKIHTTATIPTRIAEGDSARILTAIMAKAAVYAEKLKKAAFHFICREDVIENIYPSSSIQNSPPGETQNHWVYDYQIVARDRKIAENRVLLEKNREKIRLANAQLETVFHSYFSFYMPATMLAKEKQHLYQYRLLGKEKINNKNVWHIAAVSRVPGSIPWGELWIGEEDGTVFKIQADQTSIVGFEKMAQKAIEHGFMPAITTIHEYSLEKNGICFPSKTTFIEKYNSNRSGAAARPSFERSRTYYEYRDHMFFSVETLVNEKND